MKLTRHIVTAAAFVAMTTGAAFADNTQQFTGRIVDPTGGLPGNASHFTLTIDTDIHTDEGILDVLDHQGPKAFERQVENMDQGWIKFGNGTRTHIAATRVLEEGDKQVVQVLMDRPMAMVEMANNTRSTNYPFTVLELEIDDEGNGQGRMLAAADLKLSPQGEVEVEHMGPMPWKVLNVKAR